MRYRFTSLPHTAFTLVAALLVAGSVRAGEITRDAVLSEMNRYRAEQGLPPLRTDTRLEAAASDRMRDMEELQYWAHESPDGRSPFIWLRPRGYLFRAAAENLAAGFETSELLVSAWMESPGHRSNIISPIFKDCGVAIIDGSTRGRATGRSVVVLFGRAEVQPQE